MMQRPDTCNLLISHELNLGQQGRYFNTLRAELFEQVNSGSISTRRLQVLQKTNGEVVGYVSWHLYNRIRTQLVTYDEIELAG